MAGHEAWKLCLLISISGSAALPEGSLIDQMQYLATDCMHLRA